MNIPYLCTVDELDYDCEKEFAAGHRVAVSVAAGDWYVKVYTGTVVVAEPENPGTEH